MCVVSVRHMCPMWMCVFMHMPVSVAKLVSAYRSLLVCCVSLIMGYVSVC